MTNNNIFENLIIAKLVWFKKENYHFSFTDLENYLDWFNPTWNKKDVASFLMLINQININDLINYLNWKQTINSDKLTKTIKKISNYSHSLKR